MVVKTLEDPDPEPKCGSVSEEKVRIRKTGSPEDMAHVLPGLLVPGDVGKVLAVVPPHSPHPAQHSSSLYVCKGGG